MIKKCLYPVAGYGTRFLPVTKSMPKEMLPIVDKPLIQYAVEEAMNAGMTDNAFVTGRGKYSISDHFDISYELENEISGTGKEEKLTDIRELLANCSFTYTRQKQMKGLGHAVLIGERMIGDQPFGVILADDLCIPEQGGKGIMAQMVDLYKQFRCSIVAIEEVPKENISSYGVIDGEIISDNIFRVKDMVEKPPADKAPSNMAVIGRYILTPDIFDILRDTRPGAGGEIQLTDAIKAQAKNGCVMAYKFKGRRFDCGSVDGFIEATNYCYENIYKKK
ncbi:UTP--glucose-1-phosphate uridylyltransferase [hydrothermal vent metagenome]|uniref:UTP--glucose-1-phosphate uridylyltransferase n=1 Tax=hydrothermal vent metagenome TaxID=652676 RepID=A0A3B0Y6A1_9ZZZZ